MAVVKIGGHGNHRFRDWFAYVIFSRLLDLLQNHGRHFGGTIRLPSNLHVDVSVGSGGHFIRQSLHGLFDFFGSEAPSHQAFNGKNGVFGIRNGLTFCNLADQSLIFIRDRHDGRSRSTAFRVGNHFGVTAAHDGDTRVCRSKVDSNNLTHACAPSCGCVASPSGAAGMALATVTIAGRNIRSWRK